MAVINKVDNRRCMVNRKAVTANASMTFTVGQPIRQCVSHRSLGTQRSDEEIKAQTESNIKSTVALIFLDNMPLNKSAGNYSMDR